MLILAEIADKMPPAWTYVESGLMGWGYLCTMLVGPVAPGLLVLLLAAWLGRRAARYRKRINRGLCPECGYDLTGNVSGRCPECGTAIEKQPAAAAPRGSESPSRSYRSVLTCLLATMLAMTGLSLIYEFWLIYRSHLEIFGEIVSNPTTPDQMYLMNLSIGAKYLIGPALVAQSVVCLGTLAAARWQGVHRWFLHSVNWSAAALATCIWCWCMGHDPYDCNPLRSVPLVVAVAVIMTVRTEVDARNRARKSEVCTADPLTKHGVACTSPIPDP